MAVRTASPECAQAAVLMPTWRDVSDAQRRMLKEITFAELLDRARDQDEQMYYI